MPRLRTVRAKLTALVALSGLVLLAAVPVVFWTLHDELVDEADDRIETAEAAFASELDFGMRNLRLAAELLAEDGDTRRAIEARDAAALDALARTFLRHHPSMDLLFAAPGGEVLAHPGCSTAPPRLDELAEIAPAVAGRRVEGVTRHGCERLDDAPPAYMVAVPVAGGGVVVVCLPFTRELLDRAGRKLALELAITARGRDEVLTSTSGFPAIPLAPAGAPAHLDATGAGRTWASVRRDAHALGGPVDSFALVAALDVTPLAGIVQRKLVEVLVVLLASAALSLALGWRLASVMSRALRRVSSALRKLERNEYVRVEPLRTGDELEDLAVGFNTMVEGLEERDKLRSTMGKYMTESVLDHLLEGKVALGGESIEVTVLFTDIRGFTSISERMEPQALVALLNEYFTEMVAIVMQEGGVVDKYIGDAIMAVFGAPVPRPDDAVRAARAAARMREALESLNARLEQRGIAPLRTGIGLHTGEVVAGNIGSERRMEYTIIGDAVNLASRLETSTKALGVDVLMSAETHARVAHTVVARPVEEIVVKGRTQPVMTYELVGLREAGDS